MPSLYIVSCMSLKKHTERVSRRLQVYRCFLIRLTGYCVRSRSKVKPLQSCRHICARSLGTLNASQGQTTSLPRDESYNLSTRTQGFHQNEHILVIFLSKCVLALYHRVITTAWCRFQASACLMGGGGRGAGSSGILPAPRCERPRFVLSCPHHHEKTRSVAATSSKCVCTRWASPADMQWWAVTCRRGRC